MKISEDVQNDMEKLSVLLNLTVLQVIDTLSKYRVRALENLNLKEMALVHKTLKESLKTINESSDLYKTISSPNQYLVTVGIPDALAEEDIEDVTYENIGHLKANVKTYVSAKQDKKEEVYEWLKNNGFADLVKETVHAGSLQATVVKLLKEHSFTENPDDLEVLEEIDKMFNVTKKTVAVLR